MFRPLVENLYHSDPFLVLADYAAYIACQGQVSDVAWRDRSAGPACPSSTPPAGKFSSDRAIAEYCEEFQVIALDAEQNRSFFFWHVYVEGLPGGGLRDAVWDRSRAANPETASSSSLRAIVAEPCGPLAAPEPLRHGHADLEGAVIYELHVGGFTRHPSSGVAKPGCFAGLREKIPYLQALGVTHVELLPVMAFDVQDVPEGVAARGLRNYWGYSTHSFWAPHPGYCGDATCAAGEFRALVDALHQAGIRVLLDVVFNHTAEGGETGPAIHFRGIANEVFYHLDAADRRRYLDFTGCGNTVNCNHPLVTSFIVHCLEYWVRSWAWMVSASISPASSRAANTARPWQPAAALGHRVLPHPVTAAGDRRGLGRRRAVSRRRVSRHGLVASGTAATAT
jgi:hypothetical protein